MCASRKTCMGLGGILMARSSPRSCLWLMRIRSVFIISNRTISNRASQILKENTLLMCPYCLKYKNARV